MSNDLKEAMRALEKEKNISSDVLFEAIENALMSACRNQFGRTDNITVEIDRENFGYQVYATKEVVETEVDLEKLPLCLHCDGNNGRYITGGVLIARHPVHGDLNASFNRCQLAGKDKLRVRMMPPQHLGQFHHAAEELGQPLPLAIVIGASPAVMFSAASKIPFGRDELEFAGTLGREDVEVVKCKTIDVDVPANAELVIEGYVLPDVREEEGPFGEFTDSYVPVMKNHVFHATCVTHRKGAFWHDIWAGGKEDIKLLGLPIESEIYNHISKFANPDDILDIVAHP